MTKKRHKSIANQLRKAVRNSGRSGAELADATGLNQASLSRFQRGLVDPQLNNAELVAKACGFRMILIPWEIK